MTDKKCGAHKKFKLEEEKTKTKLPKNLAEKQCHEYLDEKLSEIAQAHIPEISKYINELASRFSH
jgi:hypothetical protein